MQNPSKQQIFFFFFFFLAVVSSSFITGAHFFFWGVKFIFIVKSRKIFGANISKLVTFVNADINLTEDRFNSRRVVIFYYNFSCLLFEVS